MEILQGNSGYWVFSKMHDIARLYRHSNGNNSPLEDILVPRHRVVSTLSNSQDFHSIGERKGCQCKGGVTGTSQVLYLQQSSILSHTWTLLYSFIVYESHIYLRFRGCVCFGLCPLFTDCVNQLKIKRQILTYCTALHEVTLVQNL